MKASRLVHHAHLVWRSERIIAELRLKRLLGSLGLQALAMFVLTFALLSFEIAAYFALVQVWNAILSAAVLGLCNLLIAALLMLLAARRPPSHELTLAQEVHRDALAGLTAEVQQAEAAIPTSLLATLENTAVPLLLPLIPLLIRHFSKPKSADAAAKAP